VTSWKPKGACEGGDTIPTKMGMEDAEQCPRCGNMVRWDLVDHPFFGFNARGSCGEAPASREDHAG